MSFAPRRANFTTEADYQAARQAFEDKFMQRLALVAPDPHPEVRYEGYFETDDDDASETRVARSVQTRYTALPRSELATPLDACAVCLEGLTRAQSVTTNCKHTFCAPCMTKCLRNTPSCPCCRSAVDTVTRYRARRKNSRP